jgi:hypothetical protein
VRRHPCLFFSCPAKSSYNLKSFLKAGANSFLPRTGGPFIKRLRAGMNPARNLFLLLLAEQ